MLEIQKIPKECVIRVYGTNRDSTGEWMLKNKDGICRRFNVSVVPATKDECPTVDADGCTLTNLVTKERRSCGTDLSDWKGQQYKCQFKVTGSLAYKEQILPKAITALSKDPIEWVEVKESQEYENYIMECKSDNEQPITHCMAKHLKSGRVFNIQDGLQHQVYSAFKTNLRKGVCQFEMPASAVENEANVGQWLVTLDREKKTCRFLLRPLGPKLKRDNESPATKQIHVIKDATINCAENVYYPITRCYIRTPDFMVIKDRNCKFPLVATGKWICGFNAATPGLKDIQQEIIVHESGAIDGHVDVDNLKLSCRFINEKPLKTCLFVSPNMRSYKGVSGSSEGSSPGHCSVQLKEILELEQGTWKCVIQTKHSDDHYSVDIQVPYDYEADVESDSSEE